MSYNLAIVSEFRAAALVQILALSHTNRGVAQPALVSRTDPSRLVAVLRPCRTRVDP